MPRTQTRKSNAQRSRRRDASTGMALHAKGSANGSTSHSRRKTGSVRGALSRAFENTSGYFREDGVGKIAHEVTTFVKRNPIPAIITGCAVGFGIARAVRKIGADVGEFVEYAEDESTGDLSEIDIHG